MKKIFTALLAVMLLFSIDCHADGYTKALKKFMKNSTEQQEKIEQLKTTFLTNIEQNLTKSAGSIEEAELMKSLMRRYINNELFDDLVEIYEPYFKKHVTVEELKGLTKLAKDERIAAAQKKESEISTLLEEGVVEIMSKGMATIMVGETPELPKKESHPDTSYQFKLQRYMAKTSGTIKNLTDAARPVIRASLQQQRPDATPEQLEQVDTWMKQLFDHFGQVIEINYSNHCIKTMTEEDLDALMMYYETPGVKGVEAAVVEALGNANEIGQELIKKMLEWIMAEAMEMQTPY